LNRVLTQGGQGVIFQDVVPFSTTQETRRRRSGAKVEIGFNDFQGADLPRRLFPPLVFIFSLSLQLNGRLYGPWAFLPSRIPYGCSSSVTDFTKAVNASKNVYIAKAGFGMRHSVIAVRLSVPVRKEVE